MQHPPNDPSPNGASDHPHNGASGFMCPRCGGALWEQQAGASTRFECRIGDRLSEAEMWIEHSVRRNQALLTAARSLAEHAALARRLAASAEARGDTTLAVRLEQEAREEEQLYVQVWAMVEGLPVPDDDTAEQRP
jgi:hypothetical protein